MIEMGREDDELVFQDGITAAQPSSDVVPDDSARLLSRDSLQKVAFEKWFELERPKSIDQVGSRLLAPCSASTAEFG
jgi:hypothetical protein